MIGRTIPRTLFAGAILVSAIVLLGVVSWFWLPFPIDDMSGGRLETPSWLHLFGTDKLGRDLFSRSMLGARIAIEAGFFAVLIGGLVGVTLGLASGFAHGWWDSIASSLLDSLIAFPTLLVAMLLVAAWSASLATAIVAIGFAMAAVIARLTRLLVKRVLGQDFILASRASGTSWPRVIVLHLLPNIWPTLLVAMSLQFGLASLSEASLSYLGLGTPPPNASWGSLLQEAQATVLVSPVAAIAPGVLLLSLVIGSNLVAEGLRDLLDPTLRKES